MLFPLRAPSHSADAGWGNLTNNHSRVGGEKSAAFDPGSLEPDRMHIEVEFCPSTIVVYGTFLRILLNLKENYFGEHEQIRDFNTLKLRSSHNKTTGAGGDGGGSHLVGNLAAKKDDSSNVFDQRQYRPMNVALNVVIHGLTGHLATHRSPEDPPCPLVYLDRLGFELHRTFVGTKLQLLISPVVISVADAVERPGPHAGLDRVGHVSLEGFQLRGQALFSHEGRWASLGAVLEPRYDEAPLAPLA